MKTDLYFNSVMEDVQIKIAVCHFPAVIFKYVY